MRSDRVLHCASYFVTNGCFGIFTEHQTVAMRQEGGPLPAFSRKPTRIGGPDQPLCLHDEAMSLSKGII